jgi:NitT/TauT family transport system substrate-binding protein
MNVHSQLAKIRRSTLMAALAMVVVASPALHAQTPANLQVAITPNDGYTAFFAQDLGMFRRAGLNVEVKMLANGPAIAAAVASGDLQIGFANVVTIAQARERGLPFTIVAPGSLSIGTDPSTQIVTAPNSPVRSAKDLNGKTLGAATIAGILRLCADVWIDKNGGDSSTVNFVEIAPSETAVALQRGSIAAALMVDPWLTAAGTQIHRLGNPMAAIGPRLLVTGFFANDSWLAQNSQAAKTFTAVIADAAKWGNDPKNRAAAAAIIQKATKNAAGDLGNAVYAPTLEAAQLQPILDSALKYKFIARPLSASEITQR